MDKKSRTEYSAINSSIAIVARITAILMGFAARVVFTHTLNEDYVGINGLFSNILNILSVSELGVGTAITFALYKPIAVGDKEKQKSLMLLFKKFYFFVGLFVLLAGLALIPFLDILMKDTPKVDHLIFLYCLFLVNTVLSYVSIYKRTLIDAHQQNYISVSIQTGTWALSAILQIVFLLLTRNFVVYLFIMISCTLLCNILITVKANRMYPFLKEKNVRKLEKNELDDIKKNIKAMFFHKVGEVVVNNTDNLLISALVSTASVGIYSNYFLVIESIRQVLNQMFQGIAASVGNLGVLEGRERIKKIYESTFFLAQWVFGLLAICMFQVLDNFVGFSFGSQYVFTKEITLILCINFYVLGLRQPTLIFRDSMGLFWYDRFKSVAEAAVNLVVSIILGRIFGVFGVFLGTFIGCVTTSLWIEPYVLYKYRLKTKISGFAVRFLLYISVTGLLFVGENYLCSLIKNNGIVFSFIKAFICFAITNIAYLIIYCRTKEFKFLWRKGITLIKSKLNKDEKEVIIREEEKILTKALAAYVNDENDSKNEFDICFECEKDGVLLKDFVTYARSQSVLPFLAQSIVDGNSDNELNRIIDAETDGIILMNYKYLFECRDIVEYLKKRDIISCVLKGSATASFYPSPELRKSSDIDILIIGNDNLDKAVEFLMETGFIISSEQHALHHVVLKHNGLTIELHSMLAEPFDNNKVNSYLERCVSECKNHIVFRDCMGINLPMLDDAYHAYELLLHMLQHFLREGFGLKLLTDWCFFFNREIDDESKKEYLKLVNESGIKGFSDTVTLSCIENLSLNPDIVKWMDIKATDCDSFYEDILKAGDLGKLENDRMVVLRNESIFAYFREFHHQMHLNYPKAGKVFIIWPFLWIKTYLIFVNNNKNLRGISSRQLYKKAATRSRLIKDMKLFK